MLPWQEISVWLPTLLLHVVRMGAFFVGQPLFGDGAQSRLLRIVLALALGSLMFWMRPVPVPVQGVVQMGLLAAREAVIGLALGFVLRLVIVGLSTAGEMLSHEMGFAMARVVDPVSGRSIPVISNLFEVTAILLMFELDVHHDALRIFAFVHDIVPVGGSFDPAPVWERMTAMISDSLVLGLRFAVPVLAVMVLVTAVLVMLARAVPNINLLEFSFGVRILLALLAGVYFLAQGEPVLEEMFERALDGMAGLFEAR